MNRLNISIIGIITFIIFIIAFYYFYHRKIQFVLKLELKPPDKELYPNRGDYYGFGYDEDTFKGVLLEANYDSLQIQNIIETLDFKNFDFIMTYHKKIKKLIWSPSLNDDCDYLEGIPIYPEFERVNTNYLYIYQIENGKYRNTCP